MYKKNNTYRTNERFIDWFVRDFKETLKTDQDAILARVIILSLPVVNTAYMILVYFLYRINRKKYIWDLIPSKKINPT